MLTWRLVRIVRSWVFQRLHEIEMHDVIHPELLEGNHLRRPTSCHWSLLEGSKDQKKALYFMYYDGFKSLDHFKHLQISFRCSMALMWRAFDVFFPFHMEQFYGVLLQHHDTSAPARKPHHWAQVASDDLRVGAFRQLFFEGLRHGATKRWWMGHKLQSQSLSTSINLVDVFATVADTELP